MITTSTAIDTRTLGLAAMQVAAKALDRSQLPDCATEIDVYLVADLAGHLTLRPPAPVAGTIPYREILAWMLRKISDSNPAVLIELQRAIQRQEVAAGKEDLVIADCVFGSLRRPTSIRGASVSGKIEVEVVR